jgi:Mg2+ and Co2+ transporter CorA
VTVADVPANWIDLRDPTEADVVDAWPGTLAPEVVATLAAPPDRDDLPRPRFTTGGGMVVGVFLLPVLVAERDHLFHQEIDLVLAADAILTVRKTPLGPDGAPSGDPAYDVGELRRYLSDDGRLPGHVARFIVDDVAESFLDLIDALLDLIDDLEDRVDTSAVRVVQRHISEFRHDVLRLRRILGPTRDAVRRVVDGRVEVDDGTLFPRELELAFGDVYDKLLRAGDSLESARELIGGVRDYVQAKVANDQNEVTKRLTAAASILLVPTFIVGLYGQNFHDMPELAWRYGYGWSWALIIVTTLGQLWWFRRRHWI